MAKKAKKKQRRVYDTRSLESTSGPESVATETSSLPAEQDIANSDDFISLDFGEEKEKESRQAKRSRMREEQKTRKRKRHEIDQDEDLEGIESFPWVAQLPSQYDAPLDVCKIFDTEVRSLVRYLDPTPAERFLRDFLVYRIRTALENRFKGSKVEVFGSYATDLFLPNSDIDIVVQGQNLQLFKVAAVLEYEGVCNKPQVISQAMVPVIKFEDTLTKIKVDIVLNSMSGVDSARCIRKMMAKQPGLRPLSLLIKHFLAMRNLNEVFTGGMGGYAIVCMVMSFLQMHPKIRNHLIEPENNLGTLLVEFFQLYGVSFNVDTVGIDVSGNGSYYPKRFSRSRNGDPVFAIRDPMDPHNDIGMKSYNAIKVIKQFRYAYISMTTRFFDLHERRNSHRKFFPQKDIHLSILSRAFSIPPEMMELRQHIDCVYRDRAWEEIDGADAFIAART
ncbi:hypothetical protein BX666DRAFT_1992158 [Dichotomocladium elegans]|nr:hypothetical protein BX666DRAFT_1992158 [Dichotomocladium elegans]